MGVASYGWDDIFGYREIKAKAKILSKQEADVLIVGETGTAKNCLLGPKIILDRPDRLNSNSVRGAK
jgi:hypothetical protein